jgi:hypothetical protein
VAKVEGDEATVTIKGKEQIFKTVGKYTCPCSEKCTCNHISQKPGACSCGKELKKMEEKS